MRSYILCLLIIPLALSCNRTATPTPGRTVEPYLADPGSVGFDIEPRQTEDGSILFLAHYVKDGKTALFLVQFGKQKTIQTNGANDFPMSTGEGQIIAVNGSDATVLIANLKNALQATKIPARPQRIKTLPFTFVNLGSGLSQGESGGFNAKPAGSWTAMKIFLGAGDQEAEVFLNFNTLSKKGQFSIKDADYGDVVLDQLAKVL